MLKMRKIAAFLSAVAIAASAAPAAWAADGVTIATTDGKAVTVGNTLKATVTDVTGNVAYQWYADGVAIEGATGEEYILTYNEHGKNVKCTATDSTGVATSNTVSVTSKFPETTNWPGHGAKISLNGADGLGNTAWNFKVGEKNFTVLDVHNNTEAKYYVIANDVYGMYMNTPGNGTYDPTIEGTLGYHVNTTLVDGEDNGDATNKELPAEIKASIDTDHVWITGYSSDTQAVITEPFTVKAGITVPALWEMQAYADKIIWKNIYHSQTYLWTRTPRRAADFYGIWTYADPVSSNGIEIWAVDNSGNYLVRPQFFLNGSFFEAAKIDLATAGSEIINLISQHTYAELSDIYTDDEITTYLPTVEIPQGPVVSGKVEIATTDGKAATVGNTLKATVPGTATSVTYQWYAGGVAIEGATNNEYVTTFNEHKKTVYCVATIDGTEEASNQVEVTSDFPETTAWSGGGAKIYVSDNATGQADANWSFKMTNKGGFEKSFTILDTFNNKEGKFLVIANDTYGQKGDTTGNNKWNVTETGSLGKYVNEKLIADDEDIHRLPKAMVDAVDTDHVWITEMSAAVAGVQSVSQPFTFKAGVVVPAVWELVKYAERLDMDMMTQDNNYWATRTPNTANHFIGIWEYGNALKSIGNGAYFESWGTGLSNSSFIRPMFYLNDSFFGNAKIDLVTAGSEIIKLIEEYPYSVLKENYTDDEISTYLKNVDVKNPNNYVVDITVTNGTDSTPVTSLAGMTTIAATVDVTSEATKDESGIVIVALYDENNTIISLGAKDINILKNKGDTEAVTVTLTGLENVTTDYVLKAFVWDSLYGMEPITIEAEFEPVANFATSAALDSKTRSQVFFA